MGCVALIRVAYKVIPSHQIYNACDPGLLHKVAVWFKEDWFNPEYDSLRLLLRDMFFDEFDKATGHYTHLRQSIIENGIQNPIVITAGKSIYREPWALPAGVSDYICESCGGSRLYIAQELGMDIPCIVNDQIGIGGETLKTTAEVLTKFADKTYDVTFTDRVRVQPKRLSHIPGNFTLEKQRICRRKVQAKMLEAAKNWKESNMRKCGG